MWIATRLLGLVPIPILDFFSRSLAYFAFDVLKVRRRLILKNIQIAFPEASLDRHIQMGRASIYHFIVTTLETMLGGPQNMLANMTFENSELMNQALAENQGVFLLCIHSGNFEVLGAAVSRKWKPVTVPVKFVGKGGFDKYVHEQRQRYGIVPVRSQKRGDGYRAIRDALNDGRPVGFMLDQARPGEPRLPLFGVPAKTNTSLAAIWRRHLSPLLPLLVIREKFGVHKIKFYSPIKLELTGDVEKDIETHSKIFNQTVEKLVLDAPDQYWWIHNRWK
jgi:Kdo2-lipid IVA lauroyltransferase/acyltransferase